MSSPIRAADLLVLLVACGVATASGQGRPTGTAYAVSGTPTTLDTSRSAAPGTAATGVYALNRGAVVRGYLSSWGLPPVQGNFTVTENGLVFRSSNGRVSARAATLSLAYIDPENGRAHYLFRIDSGVFETDAPGPLLDVARHQVWLGRLQPASGASLEANRPAASLKSAREIGLSPYADSLYNLFGRPRAKMGVVGRRGRAAGRLGEYIASRDSLALDPGHMTGEAQLRHALAHELGHRWQARARAQLAALWNGVPGIRDPKRYGYRDRPEHQAEAIAFAVNFLQTTAPAKAAPEGSLALLDHYELLVPGTRSLVRYLLLQPLYRGHPLRSILTTSRVRYALEK